MAIKVIICLALGYIFGCFQTGYFYGKVFKGIDVRNYGSGNAGTTNTLRTLGKPAGYIVFLGDALKAVFAVWIVRYLLFPTWRCDEDFGDRHSSWCCPWAQLSLLYEF